MKNNKSSIKLISQNKKVHYDYFIDEIFQAGIELLGTEVKSLRVGRCNLKDSFIRIEDKQAFLNNMHISPYNHGNIFNRDPLRTRRLLLHRFEINKLDSAVTRSGFTIVPLKIYFKGSLVKIDIAIAKGKKIYDKRYAIAKKDMQREVEKEFKIKNM